MIKSMKENHYYTIRILVIAIVCSLSITCCKTTSQYRSIGNWKHKRNSNTYINTEKGIKLIFPNSQWQVYTSPREVPTKDDRYNWETTLKSKSLPFYYILMASIPQTSTSFTLEIAPQVAEKPLPNIEDRISFSKADHIARWNFIKGMMEQATEEPKPSLGVYDIISKVTHRNDKKVGVLRYKVLFNSFMLIETIEENRIVSLFFSCPVSNFETQLEEYWAIFDSLEYFEP